MIRRRASRCIPPKRSRALSRLVEMKLKDFTIDAEW